MTSERLFTTEEVAGILRCSVWMVRFYVRTGRLGAFRFGGGTYSPYRIGQRHLDEFMRRREVTPLAA